MSEHLPEDPSTPDSDDATAAGADQAPPETGDPDVDAALRDLAAVPEHDLDGQLEAGENVQRTLRSRLDDLGG